MYITYNGLYEYILQYKLTLQSFKESIWLLQNKDQHSCNDFWLWLEFIVNIQFEVDWLIRWDSSFGKLSSLYNTNIIHWDMIRFMHNIINNIFMIIVWRFPEHSLCQIFIYIFLLICHNEYLFCFRVTYRIAIYDELHRFLSIYLQQAFNLLCDSFAKHDRNSIKQENSTLRINFHVLQKVMQVCIKTL